MSSKEDGLVNCDCAATKDCNGVDDLQGAFFCKCSQSRGAMCDPGCFSSKAFSGLRTIVSSSVWKDGMGAANADSFMLKDAEVALSAAVSWPRERLMTGIKLTLWERDYSMISLPDDE